MPLPPAQQEEELLEQLKNHVQQSDVKLQQTGIQELTGIPSPE